MIVEGEYIYSLRYDEFIAPLICMVQRQQRQIEDLERRLSALESKEAVSYTHLDVYKRQVTGAVSFDQAMNQFAASTGIAGSELSDYENTLKDIYTMKNICQSQASVYDLAPLNFRRRVTRPVSYYALF